MNELWSQLRDLFDTDDGSLPDLFVEELSATQVVEIYGWIRSRAGIYLENGDPTLWSLIDELDLPIKDVADPAKMVIDGQAESFRHGLVNLSVSGVRLPQLTVAVYLNELQFDYRMGTDWGQAELDALFEFLWLVQKQAPQAKISHAFEGATVRTESFAKAWELFRSQRKAT